MSIIVLSRVPSNLNMKKVARRAKEYGISTRVTDNRVCWKGLERGDEVSNSACYHDIPDGTIIKQYIETDCPATLVEVLNFMGRFATPELGDVLVWVKRNKEEATTNNKLYTVILQFRYRASTADASILTWLSFVRAGWEGLTLSDVADNLPIPHIILNGQRMGGGHYPYNRYQRYYYNQDSPMRPPLELPGLFILLRALRDGGFKVKRSRDEYAVVNKRCNQILDKELL
jgi:hypothetical protein